jgi:hypothetical protein
MNRSTTVTALLLALSLGATGALAAAPLRAEDETRTTPVPSNLEVPPGHVAFHVAHALGTQNYLCLPQASGSGLAWAFVGPQATLFGDRFEQVMTHFLSVNPADGVARATWQHSRDSSATWAAAVASSSDPAFVTPGAIPWLLLEVKGTQAGPRGGDRLTATTFIQRVQTVGGAAPAGECSTAGARAFVPYAADYVFYRARGRSR